MFSQIFLDLTKAWIPAPTLSEVVVNGRIQKLIKVRTQLESWVRANPRTIDHH